MAIITLDRNGAPSTPGAGKARIFIDTQAPVLCFRDETGAIASRSDNCSIASQAGFAADTYVTNSDIQIPSFSVQAKTTFRWTLTAAKTAAGVATPIYQVRIGSARTTADTSRLSITGPAQTAAIDNAVIIIYVTVRSVGAAGVLQGTLSMNHNLAATGFAVNASSIVEATGAGFDNSALGGLFAGLSVNGGSSAAWTLQQCRVEAKW
jgi:hypothetical protein